VPRRARARPERTVAERSGATYAPRMNEGHPPAATGDLRPDPGPGPLRASDEAEPPAPRFDLRLTLSVALGVGLGMLLLNAALAMLGRLQGLIVVVLVSLFLSFAMEPAVQWLSRRGMRRGFATMIVFVAVFVALTAFGIAMWGLIVDQVRTLAENVPGILQDLAEVARGLPGDVGEDIGSSLEEAVTQVRRGGMIDTIGSGLLGLGTTVLGGLFQFLTVLLVTFYLVADGPRLRRTLSSFLSHRRQGEVLAIWELAISKTGGYVYGRVIVAFASATFHAVAFSLMGVPYAVALGAWVGLISSLIPVVGTYLAGALPLAVALANEPISALWVLIAVVIYQQLENYILAPKITAETMALHPAVAFLSVLAGAALLGAAGALLALPAVAIVGGVLSAIAERHEIVEHQLLDEHAPDRERRVPVPAGEGAGE
jgi:predicted PurR-regulated permease PerM